MLNLTHLLKQIILMPIIFSIRSKYQNKNYKKRKSERVFNFKLVFQFAMFLTVLSNQLNILKELWTFMLDESKFKVSIKYS